MPLLNGYETIRQIRELSDPVKANVPVIAFTASIVEHQRITDAGFNDVLIKPANANEIQDKLATIVAENQAVPVNIK